MKEWKILRILNVRACVHMSEDRGAPIYKMTAHGPRTVYSAGEAPILMNEQSKHCSSAMFSIFQERSYGSLKARLRFFHQNQYRKIKKRLPINIRKNTMKIRSITE
ncbi:hypothetical protein CDAR_424981 [Caerostris darwini]|uniref:Uncharacterized protein n=1 Tax=Caerostris darwini TaxID=1538125 RepID=A0AAV4RT64_9ARAC|nr:hypothetical protein CDAR_424981 [Caerostris darwini]